MNAAVWIIAAVALAQNPPADEAGRASERTEQLKHFKQRTAEMELRRGQEAPPLAIATEPVLRYSNAEREIGSLDGAMFLWLEMARPIAAVSLSVRRQGNQVYRECTSFSRTPLVCASGGMPVWSPKVGGLLDQKLADAPEPAATKTQRLTQLRSLARRFSASCYHARSRETSELRLLTQPLYRYEDEKAGILDGGLFAFVVSNDPELLLIVEAVQASTTRSTKGGPAAWRYSLARMSSLQETVKLDGKEVWTVPNYYEDPQEDRRTGPYVEARIGVFANPSPEVK